MSNPESFIDEVNEEVRRDQLFAVMRKYGWIAVLAVIVLVGGAAANEWMKARDAAKAEAMGDAILHAIEIEDETARADALAAIEADASLAPVVALLQASLEDDAAASATLAAIADDAEAPELYRHLAVLKRVLLADSGMSAEDRIAALGPLTAAGAPFRTLAEEQIALAEIDAGQTEAAIERLQTLLLDVDASEALRQRASQVIVALGATPEES